MNKKHISAHVELTDLGFIKIQGQDAKKFLQGQLTCDVDALTNSDSLLGAHCNHQGRIISLFYLFKWEEAYYLLLPKKIISIAISALKKYAVFFKVELTESHEMVAIGYTDTPMKISKKHCTISLPASTRSIVVGEVNLLNEIHENQLSLEAWNILNIKDGLPSIYPETSGKFLPHELSLEKLGGINFEKGCYTGQEIIARMHYRSKSKNHLYQAHTLNDTAPQPGADIYSGAESKPAGIIVATAQEEYNSYHVLIITNELNHNSALFLNPDKTSRLSIQIEK